MRSGRRSRTITTTTDQNEMKIEIQEQLITRIKNIDPDIELAEWAGDALPLTAYVNNAVEKCVAADEYDADVRREMRWYRDEW